MKFGMDTHQGSQKYMKGKKYRVWKTIFNERHSQIYTIYDDEKIDIRKSQIASLANFIHFLDSYILVNFILEAKNLNMPIKTMHDCFYTNYENVKNLIPIYRKVVSKITYKVLLIQLKINKLKEDEDLIKIIKKIKELKHRDIEESIGIIKEEIKKAKYILSK